MNDSTTIKELLRGVALDDETILDLAGEPGDRRVTFSLRRQPVEPPPRAEGQARAHVFGAARGFAEWLVRLKPQALTVFADVDNSEIAAVLGDTSGALAPGGPEIVTLRPVVHPRWAPWRALLGRRQKIEDFALFVAERRRDVAGEAGRTLALELSQVRASVSVEVQRGRGRKAVNGIVVTTEVKGQRGEERVELPDEVTLQLPLFLGCDAQRLELDLTVESDREGAVSAILSGGAAIEAEHATFLAMLEAIEQTLEAGAVTNPVVTFGRPKHRPWAVVPR